MKVTEKESVIEGFLKCSKDYWSTAGVTLQDGRYVDLADWLAREVFGITTEGSYGYSVGNFEPEDLFFVKIRGNAVPLEEGKMYYVVFKTFLFHRRWNVLWIEPKDGDGNSFTIPGWSQ